MTFEMTQIEPLAPYLWVVLINVTRMMRHLDGMRRGSDVGARHVLFTMAKRYLALSTLKMERRTRSSLKPYSTRALVAPTPSPLVE
ncbi:hypothetical protein EVAR_36422_1 [Eumeta japonica]|uniref:Uncharacterized protein n=1 Tax=Eumeta variegata TaxID=151549 RepID=A0A4C1VNI9_EUMVA|nr:hypothetical protein EVAR_36422_1 [Eumeta japonica]